MSAQQLLHARLVDDNERRRVEVVRGLLGKPASYRLEGAQRLAHGGQLRTARVELVVESQAVDEVLLGERATEYLVVVGELLLLLLAVDAHAEELEADELDGRILGQLAGDLGRARLRIVRHLANLEVDDGRLLDAEGRVVHLYVDDVVVHKRAAIGGQELAQVALVLVQLADARVDGVR